MILTKRELKALQEYRDAKKAHRAPKDIVRDSRGFLVSLMQNICEEKYHISPTSKDFENATYYVIKQGMFSYYDKKEEKFVPHTMWHGKILNQIERLRDIRNAQNDYSEEFATEEEARQCIDGIKLIGKWYFKEFKPTQLSSITNLDSEIKNDVAELFELKNRGVEIIKERETHYVMLLIDSSESMLFPYLDNPANIDRGSRNYSEAIVKVQNAMQFAHEKALNALRGSAICQQESLKIFQYSFNHNKKWLNDPEILSTSPHDDDKVKRISPANYYPEGMTALYDVVDESLKVVYEKYLKPEEKSVKDIDKLIIGVLTDGEDTIVNGERRYLEDGSENGEYKKQKELKLKSINNTMQLLNGNNIIGKAFLESSVLIGLTGEGLNENKLKEIRKELNFHESISVLQSDEQSIRKAFKLWSTNAMNI